MKDCIKKIIRSFPLPLSKNHAYDLLTQKIIKKVCHTSSNCIDVGCHKGEIMDIILRYAPHGHHTGFEPLPDSYTLLKNKYRKNPRVKIYNYALSNRKGQSSFNYVITNPAYSGLVKRNYDRQEKDTEIEVDTQTLDYFMKNHPKIDLIKIDVEGGEYQVLLGAKTCLKKDKPVVIFEHGKGASEMYGTDPDDVFIFFEFLGYRIYTLKSWLNNGSFFSKSVFNDEFHSGRNYYFVASHEDYDKSGK
jgi:FkbM family methyltransferase